MYLNIMDKTILDNIENFQFDLILNQHHYSGYLCTLNIIKNIVFKLHLSCCVINTCIGFISVLEYDNIIYHNTNTHIFDFISTYTSDSDINRKLISDIERNTILHMTKFIITFHIPTLNIQDYVILSNLFNNPNIVGIFLSIECLFSTVTYNAQDMIDPKLIENINNFNINTHNINISIECLARVFGHFYTHGINSGG